MFHKKIVIASIFFALLTTLAVVFQPVPTASEANTLKAMGTVDQVFDVGAQNLIIMLEGNDQLFYIDTGSTDHFQLASLKSELRGKRVEVYYVKYWSPLESLSKLKRIAKVDVNRTTLYSQLE